MLKIYKHFFAVLLILTTVACGNATVDNNEKLPNNQSPNTSNNNTPESTKKSDITIAEQVIFDEKEIKVTVTGFENNGLFGPSLKVLIENNSAKNITIQTRNSSVNDIMMEPMFSTDVTSGKKTNDTMVFSSSELDIAGITTIKNIELSLHMFDTDTWDDIVQSNVITLSTSADESYVQEYDDSGFVAYDAEGIKVVVKKLNSSESFWGSDVYLYMENNSERNITIQANDVSINGFMVEPIFSSEIVAHKKAFDTMTFMESDLTNNGITDITNLEFKLHIFDTETWDTIKDSDIITVSF